MSDKKQSSIDWFNNELEHLLNTYGFISKKMLNIHFNRAKTMHQNEIEEAYFEGQKNGNSYGYNGVVFINKAKYYKQTFKTKNNEKRS